MSLLAPTVNRPLGKDVHAPRDAAAPWRHIDVFLVTVTLCLAAMGLLLIYSATQHKEVVGGITAAGYLKRQTLWVALGVLAMVVTAVIDYRVLRDLSPGLYFGSVLVLLAVLSPLGTNSRGAQAWFQFGSFQLQPSEYAKLVFILCLAAYCAAHRGDLDVRRLITVLVLAAPPLALIYRQPDLGTDLVFVAILMAILLVAGARPRHITVLTLIGVVGVVAVFQLGVLKQYQLDRLGAFLDPKGDTQRSTYNLNQSVNAIAGGGLTGKGLLKGRETNLSYVPEQQTDFIFTVVGEELGLAGALTLLALFALLVWRTWRAAALARDLLGTLICVGVLAMLAFQMFENVGMTMGIMPIIGIPLPFLSYGGSATIASFGAVGLVLNVHMRRFQ
jgi:rod shape determining protein RodA